MISLIIKDNYSVTQYEKENQLEWDSFIDKSKNGTFLHKINYFHYHKDRFIDCSIIIRKNNQVVAVLPGNVENNIFYTHKGLTYGGLITLNETKVEDVILYFNIINEYLISKDVTKVIYKAIPHIYSNVPSQEDEYVLFLLGAINISCGISSVIFMDNRIQYSSLRKRRVKKAQKYKLEIKTDYSFFDFWGILTKNLNDSHAVKPVHSLKEMKSLKRSFNENIKLYSVYVAEECIAGVVIYLSGNVAHVQYISANEQGKELAALDYLFDHLITNTFCNIKYFDFGTSVENQGHFLNEGLIFQKQGFGGRGVLYQQFEYETKNIISNKKEN